jgi:hypothetical protein
MIADSNTDPLSEFVPRWLNYGWLAKRLARQR